MIHVHTTVPDWLDESCWGCGAPDHAALDEAGRLLCPSCRAELSEPPGDDDPMRTSRHAYWQSHVLQCCWRCMAGAVATDDEIGLCSSCRAHMAPASHRL